MPDGRGTITIPNNDVIIVITLPKIETGYLYHRLPSLIPSDVLPVKGAVANS